jgi:hypothetical protein
MGDDGFRTLFPTETRAPKEDINHPMPNPERHEPYKTGAQKDEPNVSEEIKQANYARELDNETSPEIGIAQKENIAAKEVKDAYKSIQPRHITRVAQGSYSTLGNGTIDAVINTPVPEGYIWRIERVFVLCTSTTATDFTLYRTNPTPDRALDYTSSGNKNISDEHSLPVVYQGEILLGRWTGASAVDSNSAEVVAIMNVQILEEKQMPQAER